MSQLFLISPIRDHPEQLVAVQLLWRKHSKTLGMFPKGAFEDAADKNWILVAISPSSKALAGYLLYRITRRNVAITHLCVSDVHRGQGVARQLFKQLTSLTRRYPGIVVRCRQDFEARDMWQ